MGPSLAFERSDADRAWAVTVHGNGDGDLAAGIIGARWVSCSVSRMWSSRPGPAASVEAWTAVLGQEPAFVGEDSPYSRATDAEIGLSSAPWVEHPLIFWEVAEIEEAHRALVAAGAIPGEIADGSLAEIGTADVTNGDPATGIVDVPGGASWRAQGGGRQLVGLHQAVPLA